jgi:hypothetical protein
MKALKMVPHIIVICFFITYFVGCGNSQAIKQETLATNQRNEADVILFFLDWNEITIDKPSITLLNDNLTEREQKILDSGAGIQATADGSVFKIFIWDEIEHYFPPKRDFIIVGVTRYRSNDPILDQLEERLHEMGFKRVVIQWYGGRGTEILRDRTF